MMQTHGWTPWCGCECHTNPAYKHFAACCCEHRIANSVDCPQCCKLPRRSDGSCEEHNHHSQYNKALGKGDWVLTDYIECEPVGETLEQHIRRLLNDAINKSGY